MLSANYDLYYDLHHGLFYSLMRSKILTLDVDALQFLFFNLSTPIVTYPHVTVHVRT